MKFEYRNSSLATIAKEYTFEKYEMVEEYILDNLNEEMKKTYDRLKNTGVCMEFIILILVQYMTNLELEKLGEVLLENWIIGKRKDYYYFEISKDLFSEWKPIFDGTSLIVD